MVQDGLDDTEGVIDRHSRRQGKGEWEHPELAKPAAGIEVHLRDDVKKRDRDRGGKEDRQIDQPGVHRAMSSERLRKDKNAEENQQEVAEVRRQMRGGLEFDEERKP